MSQPERIIFLIKFGKKKNLESLLKNGELYFKSAKSFNKIKKSNNEQGDENEGAIWIENFRNIQITCNHPELGEYKFKSVPNQLSKLTQFNHNYLTCSFYAVTNRDFEHTNILEVDDRMSSFGGHALIISNPKLLIDNVFNYAVKEKMQLSAKKVDYVDLTNEGRVEINPFVKKTDHSYQKEYRMVIKNSLDDSKVLYLKKLGENGTIIPTKKNETLKFKIN
tara:strand:- start:2743 stop:3408 length:666 start_codon:yes stop_codon:yes gene_type:complete